MLSFFPLSTAAKLLGIVLFGAYPTPAIDESAYIEPKQIPAEQVAQAQNLIQSAPSCKATFTSVTDSTVTLEDFGLIHLSGMPPLHFVNIWATWCAPCRAELPILLELAETAPASIDMLNLGDNPEIVQNFATQIGAPFEQISQPAPENILQTVGAQGLPYNALFLGENLIGVRNQAIHDAEQFVACLTVLNEAL